MDVKEFLIQMDAAPHVSGYESELVKVLSDEFSKYADVSVDKFGNFIAHKRGISGGPKVMLSAHMDEIGMMVSAICDNGFVKFSPIGGFDWRTMLAQEVIIHGNGGRQKVFGVIGIKPPHLTDPAERKKVVKQHDMAIDTGFSKKKLELLIRPGDIITLNQDIAELQNGKLTGRAFDNIAGIAAMHCAIKNLEHFNHKADLYFVATGQEEIGYRGAVTASYNIKPDIGIAIDVTHGRAAGLAEHESFDLGKGPVIAFGPNINRKLFEDLKKTAIKNNIKYQVEVIPGMSGTDAVAMQITEGGMITGIISIPLSYMHTSVETIAVRDIENCGKLISDYIIELQNWEGEPCW